MDFSSNLDQTMISNDLLAKGRKLIQWLRLIKIEMILYSFHYILLALQQNILFHSLEKKGAYFSSKGLVVLNKSILIYGFSLKPVSWIITNA